MAPSEKKTVVVVAPATPEGAAFAELVASSSTAWTCQQVLPTEIGSRGTTLEQASAILVSTDGTDKKTIEGLPQHVPVIACGEEPPTSASIKPVSWLQRPSSPVLRMLLHEMLGPDTGTPIPPPAAIPAIPHLSSPPPSSSTGVWRRKTDMIIGRSAAIRRVLDTLDRIAPSSAAVAVTGESGTGKELVARALHYSSPRAGARFIALNCAAIPEQLFEAELFGYMRGAFTGAVSNRTGAFEAAHNGTLFLDEIGEMPKTLQPKLLRVLERGEVTPLGSNETRKVAVRVVTATNRNLEAEVRANNFRQDLFYRLRVCHIEIAPLRERMEDIAPLVAHHLSIIAGRERKPITPRLSAAALEKLLGYSWPGNVRELVNVLEAAALLAPADVIGAEHLQFSSPTASLQAPSASTSPSNDDHSAILAYREAKQRFDAEYYARLLRVARGNVSLVSKLAQKTRKEIYDALRRAGLEADAYRDEEAQS